MYYLKVLHLFLSHVKMLLPTSDLFRDRITPLLIFSLSQGGQTTQVRWQISLNFFLSKRRNTFLAVINKLK